MQKPNLTYKIKRKAVAHYDVQSITANLHSPVVVSQKNTITGASAASKNTCVDQGDGKSNSLVMSCPCFRNEIGTEKEISIILNRLTASQSQVQKDDSLIIHCPSMASGLSILEDCSDRWRYNICPYQKMMLTPTLPTATTSTNTITTINNGAEKNKCFIIEYCDIGALYYRIHFYGLEHQNWFGIDDNLGPIAISIRKERVNSPKPSTNNFINNNTATSNGLYSGTTGGGNNTTTINIVTTNNNNHNNINNKNSITNGQTNGSINLSVTTSSSASSNSSTSSTSNSSTTISSSSSSSSTTATANSSSTSSSSSSVQNNRIKHQYRIIIRTSQLSVLRGTVYEDYIPSLASSRHSNHNNHHAKEVLEYIAPELNLATLRLGVSNADEQLLKLDEQVITRTYKVGVLYCKAGQGSEEEMYNNENSSPQFEEFLSCLGEQVRLKGFDKYRAGLDNKTDTTGLYSIYANYHDCEIMFHVSTLLPYTPNNKQQLLRKRHIGNDIVTIVFQEPGALPFTPRSIRSHFQHVFIIVRVLPPEPCDAGISVGENNGTTNSGVTRYAIAVTRSKEVSVFGPPIPDAGIFIRGKEFTEFLLAKIINGENAAHKSEKFSSMAQRTRHGYLKDLATNYVTNTTLNDISCGNSASAKLVSIFGSSKRRGSHRVKDWQFIGDQIIQGSIVWEATVNDFGQSKLVDCYVGISCDTFIIIEEITKQTLFACPNISIIGWDASHSNYIEIFVHQGECLRLNCKDQGLDLDEISEIKTRLSAVTNGCQTKELMLKRNNQGQLGFHIEPDGIVTDVEKFAFAWNAGLRPNCRIVKICEVVTATLNYNDMIDYLKTSSTVKITILDPNRDGSPKRGCNLAKCPYLSYMVAGSSLNSNNNNNINNLVSRDSHLSIVSQQQPPTNSSLNHGGDYENIRIMNDPKKYHLPSEFKNGLYHHRYHYTNTSGGASSVSGLVTAAAVAHHQQANKNNTIGGLPLVSNYSSTSSSSSPYGTSQSSKSLTVSPEKETDKINKLTPSLSSSNIYSNLGSSSQLHLSSSPFVSGLARYTNSKREPLRPKSTTNECTSLSSSSTNLHNPNMGSPQLHLSSSSFVSGLRFANSKREPLRPKSTTNECTSLSSSSSGSSLSTINTPFLNNINNNNNNSINTAKHQTLPGSMSIPMSPSPMLSSYAIAMPMLCTLNSSSSSEEDIDTEWPTLVETATKAMAINSTGSNSDALSVKSDNALEQWVREFEANVNSTTSNGHLSSSSTPTSSLSATTSTSLTLNHPTTSTNTTNHNNSTLSSSSLSTATTTTTTSSSLSSTSSLPTRRGTSGENLKELKETVQKLQYDLVKEQSDKAKLAELVKSLEKENSRLQEERKNAILQLKTLTDFFFHR